MSLAFSVEGFLFYVHLHRSDKFKVNRTLFILDFVSTIVFLLAVESDRFASVADPDPPIREEGGQSSRSWDKGGGPVSQKNIPPFGPQFGLKMGGGRPPGPSPRFATVPPLWASRELSYWACREVGFCTLVSFFMALNLGKTPHKMWSSRNLFFLYMYWLYLFFMHLCDCIICFRYFAKKNKLNEPLLWNYSEDEEETD